MIEVINVNKNFKAKNKTLVKALKDVSFTLPNKGLIFITGKSGSGKSTILNILGTIDKPSSGDIIFNGKNITNYNERKLLKIRKDHIGFVFQDYQLIEDLNVEDNIKLAMGSLSKKISVDKILEDVDLKGYEKRNVTELSGGEKQRVAIARALSKNPTVILADEPTGNLDEQTSYQIFKLLKNISLTHLVVVITHDVLKAQKFADGIIELQEGIVIKNNIEVNNSSNEERIMPKFNKIKSLSKLALGILKRKKIKVIITSIIVTVAFSLFGFSMTLLNFDIPKTHAESMIKSNEEEVIISKNNSHIMENSLFADDIKTILSNVNSNYTLLSKLYVDNEPNKVRFGYNPEKEELGKTAFYTELDGNSLLFESYKIDKLNELNIIGEVPKNAREVIIPEILADYLVVNGFSIFNDTNKLLPNVIDARVKEQKELLGKKLWLENTYIIITGILKDDELVHFVKLKEMSSNEAQITEAKLYDEFKSVYNNFVVYVNENFFEISNFERNNVIPDTLYKIYYTYKDKNYYDMSFTATINEELVYTDGKKEQKISSLNKDEIIISKLLLDEILDYKISMKIRADLKVAKDKYDRDVANRDKKIKEQEELLLTDPNYEYVEIPEIPEIDYEKIYNNAYDQYFNSEKVLGSKLAINIAGDTYEFTIKGYQGEDNYSYLSNDFTMYNIDNNLVSSMKIKEADYEKLKDLFTKFPINEGEYNAHTKFSDKMLVIKEVVIRLSNIFKYITIAFLSFSILLFGVFIINSIITNKAKIGILKSLGYGTFKIIKIFIIESLIIGFITLIGANIINILMINISNNYITRELAFYARPVMINPYIPIYILIVICITIFVNFIIPSWIIAKIKPINLIK